MKDELISDLYMCTDILLLADVMEMFRTTSLHNYGVDPVWYYIIPSYTWDYMLKHTKYKFQILKDVDMLLIIEDTIHVGISMCNNKFGVANNKYMTNYN